MFCRFMTWDASNKFLGKTFRNLIRNSRAVSRGMEPTHKGFMNIYVTDLHTTRVESLSRSLIWSCYGFVSMTLPNL